MPSFFSLHWLKAGVTLSMMDFFLINTSLNKIMIKHKLIILLRSSFPFFNKPAVIHFDERHQRLAPGPLKKYPNNLKFYSSNAKIANHVMKEIAIFSKEQILVPISLLVCMGNTMLKKMRNIFAMHFFF